MIDLDDNIGNKICGRRNPHASNTQASCGYIKNDNVMPNYRCDLQPGHRGQHHACGATWQVNWY